MKKVFDTLSIGNSGKGRSPISDNGALQVRIALQGGGGLGAYEAGVLQVLDENPMIDVVEGTGLSAGATNLYALKYGGSEGLGNVWNKVGEVGDLAGVMNKIASFTVLPQLLGPTYARVLQGAGVMPTTLDYIRNILDKSTDTDNPACPNMKMHITTAQKVDSERGLEIENVREVIHSGYDLDLDVIMASCALEELASYERGGVVTIDGEAHWDGAYSGNNPSLSMFENKDKTPLIIISVDDTEVRASAEDPNIVYGRIHDDVVALRDKVKAPVYHIALEHGDGIGDHLRHQPSSDGVAALMEAGRRDAQECLLEIEHDLGINLMQEIEEEEPAVV